MMKKSINPLPDYAKYSSMAITMAVIITGGVAGGWALDRWIVTGFPLFIIICSLASVSLAIYIVTRGLIKRK